jgi:hypothetical protein
MGPESGVPETYTLRSKRLRRFPMPWAYFNRSRRKVTSYALRRIETISHCDVTTTHADKRVDFEPRAKALCYCTKSQPSLRTPHSPPLVTTLRPPHR